MTTTYNVSSEGATFGNTDTTTLNGAIRTIDTGAAGNYVINISGTIDLTTQLLAINLPSGSTLTISGVNSATLDGENSERGLFVYSGDVTIENLLIENAVAVGGAGGNGSFGGGGGAGLGGGLFVAGTDGAGGNNADQAVVPDVTLVGVSFSGDAATGGAGGRDVAGENNGGGGGLGGSGGAGGTSDNAVPDEGGGGGGIGSTASGGVAGGNGGKGIVPGPGAGGSGADLSGRGGSSGGGGGAGSHFSGGGGGGVDGAAGATLLGGDGGFGGGGGGGGDNMGLFGGFGGGGGGRSGNGGFGGGGGADVGNHAGFGGGAGASGVSPGGGGGGLGAGGDIFVEEGATLTIQGGTFQDGTATGGSGKDGGADGQGYGNGLFLQGDASTTFAAAAGQTTTLAFTITDQNGSANTSGAGGSGSVVIGTAGKTGTVILSGTDTYTGTTKVAFGTLEVDGSIAESAVTVHSGAALGGTGTTGAVTVNSGGTFAPGDPSTLTVASLTLTSGATFVEEIGGASPGTGGASGYDQTIVDNGTVSLGGATLNVSLVNGFAPAFGESFTIIANETGTAVSGTFAGLAQGGIVWASGAPFQINYNGGVTGHDVTLTTLATSFGNVSSAATLSADIRQIDLESQASGGNGTNYIITLAADSTLTEAAQLYAVNLAGNDTLTINGNGATLNGVHTYNGLFVYSGNVTVSDLTIENAKAVGGAGGIGQAGAGGGAGLGGGLFVAAAGNVTLNSVSFNGDSATGGAGGSSGGASRGGGGGLEGGAGGHAVSRISGGGGGVGLTASGGVSPNLNGGAGIIPGAGSGAHGSAGGGGTLGAGGASAGGGGAGEQSGGAGGAQASPGFKATGGFGGGGASEGGGGFGGGGGGGRTKGGGGGFGGGGGGTEIGVAAAGGFGGGAGGGAAGGGGLGAGGDIFVQQGGTLIIDGGTLSAGSVVGGASGAGGPASPGEGLGSGIFLQGNGTLKFAPAAAQTETIGGVITDQTGSGGNAGIWGLLLSGAGTLVLAAADTYSGGTRIGAGTLELGNGGSIVGNATFAGAGATLRLDTGTNQIGGGEIVGAAVGDTIDLGFLAFALGDQAVWQQTTASAGTLSFETANGATLATLALTGQFVSANFKVTADSQNHVLVNVVTPHVVDDFNADGISDIFWRNNSDESLVAWLMNGSAVSSGTYVTYQGNTIAPDASWSVAGIGDFNGDGDADIVWRQSTTGALVDWSMNGSTVQSDAYLTYQGNAIVPDSSWSVAGVGDFNGDGDADILWQQSTTGTLVDWSMNGSVIKADAYVTYQGNAITPDSSWSVAGIGDFNGDGNADILWRQSTTGALVDWSMNGSTVEAAVYLTYQGNMITPDSTWSVAGIGDFNGDGDADVLWRQSTTGSLAMWLMNGSVITSGNIVTYQGNAITPDSTWSIVEVGNFSSPGNASILWQQSTTGTLVEWQMNGSQIASSQTVTSQGNAIAPSSNWQVQARPTDFV